MIQQLFSDGLEQALAAKRAQERLTAWFRYQEVKMAVREELAGAGTDPDSPAIQAEVLCRCIARMPLSILPGSVIAGTQDDSFSPSYALINPAFRVEQFTGYCDALAIYRDLEPDAEFTPERIARVRDHYAATPTARALAQVYAEIREDTAEAVYFVEPVTGHLVPDVRPILAKGVDQVVAEASAIPETEAMRVALTAAKVLSERYSRLAADLAPATADPAERRRLELIARNCANVPARGAENLHEAVQAFVLLWQVMCLEQAPNPYAFSVGNLDRILAPYLKNTPHAEAVLLLRHLLAFFMVGRRCWAISQNLMVGGRDADGNDLTSPMTDIILEAFYESNHPQPALSLKLHRNTPEKIYRQLGRFLFSPGHSTPSVFNDDELFRLLERKGIARADWSDYGIAGCQEPLIMGRENGNTTNSWLNLAKILELTLNDGRSLLTGKSLGQSWRALGYPDGDAAHASLHAAFLRQLDYFLPRMAKAANACTEIIGRTPAPFTSALLSGLVTGRDYRDPYQPGTPYQGSGCLVHGLSVVADSLTAVADCRREQVADAGKLLAALRNDFRGAEPLRAFLLARDKYGNGNPATDALAAQLAARISDRIRALRNPAGRPFHPDFSTPSTHLLYGYWVGATPDGRHARTMLGYGVDPLPGRARHGLPGRILSARQLPFREFTGGYASHLGLAPGDFAPRSDPGDYGLELKARVLAPLFGFADTAPGGGYYAYFNVDSASHLRQVLADPAAHAPNGIYILRIHGTFVNFLDLSPAIQEDIIARLSG